MRKLFLLFFLLILSVKLKGATFIVNSNADAGVGTLRDAIISANANGTATTDYIYFELSGSNMSHAAILLLSELPILSSNVVIDATTQILTTFNHPSIKVRVVNITNTYFHGIRLDNANHVEIYGLSFGNFYSDPNSTNKKGAIYLYNSSDIIIGAANKSNCFMDNYAGILALPLTPKLNNTNIKISSNIFGLDESGLIPNPNEHGIYISYIKDSEIGGSTALEGNIITSNTKNGIVLTSTAGNINISNNTIGLNQSGNVPSPSAIGIYINGSTHNPKITNNIIAAQNKGIMLEQVNGGFIIALNRIGTGQTGTEKFKNETGIHIKLCNKGLIGGSNISDENKIANNETAILIDNAYPISILKNSFYCNIESILFVNLQVGTVVTQSRISTILPTKLEGKFLPNAKIELFYNDSCPGADCQGKTWFATLITDANGLWSYNGVIAGNVTSMGTNPDGATSTFSKPYIDDFEHVPSRTLCGQKTGSITKMKVYDVNNYEWTNEDGQPVGNTLDIYNLPEGIYYLRASQNGACSIVSTDIAVYAIPIVINDISKLITDATCSGTNGSITGITVSNNLKRKWYEQGTDKFISDDDNLLNVPYGRYYFIAGSGTCALRSTTYLINNNAAYYELKEAKVEPVTCGQANGKITITGYQTNSTFTFKWFDENNNEIGYTETLSNLSVGKYKLVAYSSFSCSSEVGVFNVDAAPLPTVDYSTMLMYISCDGKSISTTGVAVSGTGPFTYKWLDENNNLVSNHLNLAGVPVGKYKLAVIDNYSCMVEGELVDFTTLKNTALIVPNSITPNGDGINDEWQINDAQNYRTADFSIYSRNGNRVFYSRGYTQPFNGIYNGKILPTGVYYYVIDLKTDCGKISGSLTILR
jgi:gliding motility-associated-like protein